MVKVSVYCTVYNHADYLRDALEGFVSQNTDFEYEVFVHDDASTDHSADIIREYECKFPNIIHGIYQSENQYSKGISIFHKYLFPRFNGEYIAVCEGDDYWCDNEKLKRQVHFLDTHPEYSACVHNTKKLDCFTNTETDMYSNDEERDICFEEVIQGGSVAYQTSSLMFRRSLYQKGLPRYARSQWDYPVSIFLTTAGKVRYLNRTMSVYRYGTPESYTRRTMQSKDRRIRNGESIVNMLRMVDEDTGFEHSAIIEPIILTNQYQIEVAKGNYKALIQEPLKKLFDKARLLHKVRVYVSLYCGPLVDWLLRIIRKNDW